MKVSITNRMRGFAYALCVSLLAMILIVPSSSDGSEIKKFGLPLITNYPRSVYKAGTQNWALAQNQKGFVYIANNDGLIEFDGQHWTLMPIPNNTIVRSVMAVGDTIFVGAFEQFGFFAPDESGKLNYHSLSTLVPEAFQLFDEIWKIHKTSHGIVFQSFKYVFVYHDNKLEVIEPHKNFGHSYTVGNKIYIVDIGQGLFMLKNGHLVLASNDPLFSNNEVRCIMQFDDKQLLIGFVNKGLYLFNGNTLTPWKTRVNEELIDNIVFSGIRLGSGNFAFGSIQNGVYLSNSKGEILQHINRFKGLLNNTILSLFEDRQGNLWLGLDNGLDYLEINSPLSIFDYNYHVESTYTSVVFDGKLYVGTNQGLFVSDLLQLDNTRSANPDFSLVAGTEGQVWKLSVIDGHLFCGHNFGCFEVKGYKAVKIADDRGYWTFIRHTGNSDTIIAGTYSGLVLFVRKNNVWQKSLNIAGFEESSRTIVEDKDNVLWIAHGYRGLFRVTLKPDLSGAAEVVLYAKENGLPPELPYNVHRINKDLVFSTKSGFYEFHTERKTFVKSAKYNLIFTEQPAIDNLFPDEYGNIWYFAFGRMGIMRLLEDGTYTNITAPYNRINPLLIESYENLYINDSRNVFIGSQKGLLHYDPYFKKDYHKEEPVYFREIIFSSADSSRVIYNPPLNNSAIQEQKHYAVPFELNNVSFRFANPAYDAAGSTVFSYRLIGFEQNWSAPDKNSFKEYTNLPEGNYLFEVRVSNINQVDDKVYTFAFEVNPPFYRSGLAYGLFSVLFLLILAGNIVFIRRRINRTQLREKEKHEKKLAQQEVIYREKSLLAEKEIIHLRNESLQTQVSHKNKELANTTLHLIHKNKILNGIKYQLNALIDSNLSKSNKAEIEMVINKINKELKNEKFQEVFDDYFDDVHQDFISRLKEKHQDLSPKELRLCAYLKMNLSTKEIAPLMNISVRGVEIGRYRLRKKLNLDREENLINYLINF